MGPKTKQLTVVLEKLILILNEDKEHHWASWMSQAKSRITSSDYSGIEKVLGAYGGMGSFTDVRLEKISRSNEHFSELRSEAWRLATEIKREHEANR